MDEEILKKIEEQGKKIEAVYNSVEKIRKYFLWTFIITVAVIILPLLGLLIVIPSFLNVLSGTDLGL